MPLKILAAFGQNGNGSINSDTFTGINAGNIFEKPKAKILAGLGDLKAKILAGRVFIETSAGEIPGYDTLANDVKAKILAKILAGGPKVFVEMPPGDVPEYDALSPEAKAKILAKILADLVEDTNNIINKNLPDSYEESICSPFKIENEKLRRMVGTLYVENYNLKKKNAVVSY